MDMYSLLREIADSWVLLAMFLFFLGVAVWAYLPSQSTARMEAQLIPFRDAERDGAEDVSCNSSCADCSCKSLAQDLKGQFNDR